MWGTLGEYTFEPLCGPENESLELGTDLAEHARIGRKPTLQQTGIKLQAYKLNIKFHHTKTDIDKALQWHKEAMEEGRILDLITGNQPASGTWAGQWIIESMKVSNIARIPGGLIHSLELELSLKEHTERDELKVSNRPKPPAVRKTPKPPDPPPKGPGYR